LIVEKYLNGKRMHLTIVEEEPILPLTQAILEEHLANDWVDWDVVRDVVAQGDALYSFFDWVMISMPCGPTSLSSNPAGHDFASFVRAEGDPTCSEHGWAVLSCYVLLGVLLLINPSLTWVIETSAHVRAHTERELRDLIAAVVPDYYRVVLQCAQLSAMSGERYFFSSRPVSRVEDNLSDPRVANRRGLLEALGAAPRGYTFIVNERNVARRMLRGALASSVGVNLVVHDATGQVSVRFKPHLNDSRGAYANGKNYSEYAATLRRDEDGLLFVKAYTNEQIARILGLPYYWFALHTQTTRTAMEQLMTSVVPYEVHAWVLHDAFHVARFATR
jgi:hypothetical protein